MEKYRKEWETQSEEQENAMSSFYVDTGPWRRGSMKHGCRCAGFEIWVNGTARDDGIRSIDEWRGSQEESLLVTRAVI